MTTTEGIKTVLHPVSDLEKAKPVYAALLGVEPMADESYYVGFEAEGQQIGLVPNGGPQEMTSPVAFWTVADIEAKLAELTEAGASVKEARARGRWGPPGGHGHRPRRQRPRARAGRLRPPTANKVSVMDITIHSSFLPQNDPEAAIAFYRDALGFEVRNDVGYEGMHWITVGPPGQPDVSIVLYPPEASPGITEDEKRMVAEMMAKGTYATAVLASGDLEATFERLQAGDAEVVQEPTDQPYGVRDCAFRDPAGNLLRIQQRS